MKEIVVMSNATQISEYLTGVSSHIQRYSSFVEIEFS